MTMSRRSFLGFLGATALVPVISKLGIPNGLPTLEPKTVTVKVNWNPFASSGDVRYEMEIQNADIYNRAIGEFKRMDGNTFEAEPGKTYSVRVRAVAYGKSEPTEKWFA